LPSTEHSLVLKDELVTLDIQHDLDDKGIAKTAREEKKRKRDAVLEAVQAKAESEKMMKLYKQHVLQEPVPEGGFVPLNSLGGIKPAPVKQAVESREEIGTFGD
jgi:hypothetical protein